MVLGGDLAAAPSSGCQLANIAANTECVKPPPKEKLQEEVTGSLHPSSPLDASLQQMWMSEAKTCYFGGMP